MIWVAPFLVFLTLSLFLLPFFIRLAKKATEDERMADNLAKEISQLY